MDLCMSVCMFVCMYVCMYVIGEKEEKEQWPGPFNTARQMIRQREAAAQVGR